MNPTVVIDMLRPVFGAHLLVGEGAAGATVVLLHGEAARVTTTLEIGGGVVRVFAGRIVHALPYEDAEHAEHVVAVVDAIQRGGASELYDVTDSGMSFAGHVIDTGEVRYETTDRDLAEVVRVPL